MCSPWIFVKITNVAATKRVEQQINFLKTSKFESWENLFIERRLRKIG